MSPLRVIPIVNPDEFEKKVITELKYIPKIRRAEIDFIERKFQDKSGYADPLSYVTNTLHGSLNLILS